MQTFLTVLLSTVVPDCTVKFRRSLLYCSGDTDVPVAQPRHREAARHIVSMRRLCDETKLRLAQTFSFAVERLPRARQSRLHGAVEHRPDHVDLRTAAGDEETRSGRKGIQGD